MGAPPDFSRRIPQLDGLRGLAIFMVVAHHLLPTRLLELGWSGVDLFFVLSGFLIGGILLDARESSNYFKVFYIRRICRIVPLYIAFLGLAALCTHFLKWSMFSPVIPWESTATFSQNFWMAIHGSLGSYAMGPTWSLAIEEQFYLLLPAVIYFVNPSRLPWLLGAGVISAPLIRLAIYASDHSAATAIYVLLPCRMNALSLGVLTAYFVRQPRAWRWLCAYRREIRIGLAALAAASAFLLIRPAVTEPLEMFLGFDFFGVLYTVLLIASLVDPQLAKALQARWLMGLGGIAYFVYLTHHLIFGLTVNVLRGWQSGNGMLAVITGLVLTIAIAKISWRWFERPFINLGHRANYSGKGEGTASTAGTQPALEGAQL